MKKIDELRQEVANKKAEARTLLDTNVDDAEKVMVEVRKLEKSIKLQEELDKEEERKVDEKIEIEEREDTKKMEKDEVKNGAMAVRALIKTAMKKELSKEERTLLANGAGGTGATANPWGVNGEGYILPQDISTNINKLVRQYKSFRDVLGYIPTTALTGSFPVEGFETVTGLSDFSEDGTTEVPTADDIKFVNKKFALAQKGAIIPISNTLLSFTDQALLQYVAEVFARKAVITENAMAIVKLKEGKTIKDIADWKALKASINVDLDPAALANACICVNQDGFNVLDSALDGFGRPVLQPDPTQPTRKIFMGLPVNVFSNYMLPTVSGKAPIFYGDCMNAVKFVDKGQFNFAVSTEAGFTKNMTYSRVIEYLDVVQVDSSDKIYIAGELTITTGE